jgi:hypothetical protein
MKPFLLIGYVRYEEGEQWIRTFETEELARAYVTVDSQEYRPGRTSTSYMIEGNRYDEYQVIDLRTWMASPTGNPWEQSTIVSGIITVEPDEFCTGCGGRILKDGMKSNSSILECGGCQTNR